jgi:hypothetical protein
LRVIRRVGHATGWDPLEFFTLLQLGKLFVRGPVGGARPERWHIDGPRVVPYSAFASDIPQLHHIRCSSSLFSGPPPQLAN